MKSPKKKTNQKQTPTSSTFLHRKAANPHVPKKQTPFLSQQRMSTRQSNPPTKAATGTTQKASQSPKGSAPQLNRKAAGQKIIQRRVIRNAQNQLQSIAFTLGNELKVPFVRLAQNQVQQVGGNGLDKAGFLQLREHVLRRRGTISDHERLFMAGLLDANNRNLLLTANIQAGNTLNFPFQTLTRDRLRYLDGLTRETIPAEWEQLRADRESALMVEGNPEKGIELWNQSELRAREAISSHFGSFRRQGKRLLQFADQNSVSIFEVLKAILAAASDNSPGDKVMAGTVYAIAKQANNVLCADIIAGRIKVDALSPAALKKLPGSQPGTVAAYAPLATEAEGLKGDTIYLPTHFNPLNVAHRSAVIHELRHAESDKATGHLARPAQLSTANVELDAFQSQAKYILGQLEGLPQKAFRTSARQIIRGVMTNPLYWALLLEAKGNRTREDLLRNLLAVAPNAAVQLRQLQIDLQVPAGRSPQRLLNAIIRRYQLPAGHTTEMEGLKGESIIDWM